MNFLVKVLFFSLIKFSLFSMQLQDGNSKNYLVVSMCENTCDKVTLFDGKADQEKFSFSTPNIKKVKFSNNGLHVLVVSGHSYVNVLSTETGASIKEFCMCFDHKKQDALKMYPELEPLTREDY